MAEPGKIVRLARPLGRAKRADLGPLKEYLAFRLADETYAVVIDRIGEILRMPPVTRVPRAKCDVLGIVGVRGRVLTVLDVRMRLGLARPEPTRHSRILVLPAPKRDTVGLYVDEVLQVARIADSEIELPSRGLGSSAGEHVMGLARLEGLLVVIANLEPLLGEGGER